MQRCESLPSANRIAVGSLENADASTLAGGVPAADHFDVLTDVLLIVLLGHSYQRASLWHGPWRQIVAVVL